MARSKGVYKRKDSPYWWIEYTGPDGKRRQESTKTTLKTEADYLLAKRRKEAMEGVIPTKTKKAVMFADLIKDYLVWAERQKSFRSKKNRAELLLKEFGNIPLTAFTTKLVEQYQTNKLNDKKKPATVNRDMATLKHMFTKAVEWEMVPDAMLRNIRRVKLLQENNRRLRYLAQEECAALVDACAPHLKPIVITALHTGMRKGEILNLTWDRVDLKHGFILLDNDTKNGERREIPINKILKSTLENLLVENVEGHKHVFHNRDGEIYIWLKKSFQSACTKAKITNFRFHDLRHTFASHLVMGGADLTTVKELLGHKTLTMTLRYAHLAPSHKAKALEMLGEKIGAPA